MYNEINNQNAEAENKYGITVSCRIPALLHKDIGNEAALRGISFAKQLSSVVQSGHHKEASTNAEINILIREKENLQKEVQTLTQQLEKQEQKLQHQEQDEQFFAPLRRNRDLLKKYASSGTVPLATLEQEGFDISFVTQTLLDQDKQILCILDMCYRQENNRIIIHPISKKKINPLNI